MGVPMDENSIAKPKACGEDMEIRQATRRLTLHEKMGCRESRREIIVERFSELEDGEENRVHSRRSRSSHRRETLKVR